MAHTPTSSGQGGDASCRTVGCALRGVHHQASSGCASLIHRVVPSERAVSVAARVGWQWCSLHLIRVLYAVPFVASAVH